nr:hypothetical protein [Edaphobacter flagellatus]
MGLLGKLLHIQAIHHAVDSDQHMRLLVIGVDPLTHSDQSNPGKVQPLEDAQRILGVPRQAAAVIEQDDVEGTSRRERSVQQTPKPRAVRADTAQCLVGVDMLFEKDESASMGVLAANPKLVLNRARTLKITGVAGVSGTSQNHD